MYAVIVNPIAGNGKALAIYEQIKGNPHLKQNTRFYISEYKGHITKMIKEMEDMKQAPRLLFVIGGDGTMHEVANALENKNIKIVYIPGGSGNDFSRGININTDTDQIVEDAIRNEKEAMYSLSSYETDRNGQQYFINCFGVGFDAVVTKSAGTLRIRKLLHKLRLNSLVYVFALLRELFSYQAIKVRAIIDGEEKHFQKVLFLSVNNQPYMGGGMKINPDAINNKDEFSIIVVDSIPKWKVLFLFGTVFFGKHINFKNVQIFKAKEVIIEGEDYLPFQVDGEYSELKHAIVKKSPSSLWIKGIK
ncbi:MAG TPA: diacylglycerol kinase family protein [Pseudogracilibacillus sp.]|nr:diacylglycerol kinase family protein [Pseudogracilibacillus sp.]